MPDERRSKLQKHGSPLRHIYRVFHTYVSYVPIMKILDQDHLHPKLEVHETDMSLPGIEPAGGRGAL